jgi:hypothetical protein
VRLALLLLLGSVCACANPPSYLLDLAGNDARGTEAEEAPRSERLVPVERPIPADPMLMGALQGRWVSRAKITDAIVPSVVLELGPDGQMTLFRDDSGGSRFSLRYWGTWNAWIPGPSEVEIRVRFTGVSPSRQCFAIRGTCRDYQVPFTEDWRFRQISADELETPGAIWQRAFASSRASQAEPQTTE